MKTPEEIKRGLVHCSNDSTFCNAKCSYFNASSNGVDCATEMHGDALAYIQQLERENAQKDERIKQYEQDTNGLWFLSGLDKQPVRLNCSARWISVEERLPEGEVLAANFAKGTYGYKEYIIGYVFPPRVTEPGGYYAENDYETLHDVTHWMPLPEPPEEGEK